MKVVDFSFSRPSIAELKASGVVGVIRYLRGPGKAATHDEVWGYINAGLSVALVDEIGVYNFRGGYSQGVLDGQQARAAMRALGLPDEQPYYVAFDTDILPGTPDWQNAIAYMRGHNEGGGCGKPLGAYGEMELENTFLAMGLVRIEWESESRAFPGNAIDDPHAAVIQRFQHTLGVLPANEVDENDVLATDWGQYPRPGTPAPTPSPTPTASKEYRMVPFVIGGHPGYVKLSPDGTTLLACFGEPFDPKNPKVKAELGVQMWALHAPGEYVAPDPVMPGVFVVFKDGTTGVAPFVAGVQA